MVAIPTSNTMRWSIVNSSGALFPWIAWCLLLHLVFPGLVVGTRKQRVGMSENGGEEVGKIEHNRQTDVDKTPCSIEHYFMPVYRN